LVDIRGKATATLPSPAGDAPQRRPADPGNPWLTASQRFILEIDGVAIGTFTEVSGLSVEVDDEKIEEGGQNHFVHRRPGRMSWPNIVLKRGVVDDDNLFNWFARTSGDGYAGESNTLSMLTGAITLITDGGDRLRSWAVDRAFPVKWTGPTFAVSSTDMPTEELEIAHHGFKPKNV
jgi:phage tail-like protein